MRTRTLTQLRDGVADRADVTVAASGCRHTHTVVDARINRAIQRWLLMCAEAGDDTRLKINSTVTATSSTADANGWEPRQYVALPTDFMLLRGIDALDGTEPIELMPVEELERNDTERLSSYLYADSTGFPVGYRIGGYRASDSAQIVQVFPKADAVYTVKLRYIPVHTDLTTGSDTIDFIAGGEEWVINDAAAQTLRADGMAGNPEVAAMYAENRVLESKLAFLVASRGGTAARRKLDTRGRRRALLQRIRGSL